MCTENCIEWGIRIHFMINGTGIVRIMTQKVHRPWKALALHCGICCCLCSAKQFLSYSVCHVFTFHRITVEKENAVKQSASVESPGKPVIAGWAEPQWTGGRSHRSRRAGPHQQEGGATATGVRSHSNRRAWHRVGVLKRNTAQDRPSSCASYLNN